MEERLTYADFGICPRHCIHILGPVPRHIVRICNHNIWVVRQALEEVDMGLWTVRHDTSTSVDSSLDFLPGNAISTLERWAGAYILTMRGMSTCMPATWESAICSVRADQQATAHPCRAAVESSRLVSIIRYDHAMRGGREVAVVDVWLYASAFSVLSYSATGNVRVKR